MAKTTDKIQEPEILTGLERQKDFLDASKKSAGGDSFFITEKVMESMRDSGYRDIRPAINDLIDNSEQAGAKKIAVLTTTDREDIKNARERISNIAVIDDGHGMYPDMLKYAIAWGGTDRHNQRDGLGRFGFGLPTAAISVTPVYEVYSKVKDGEWHKIKIDLGEIAKKAMKEDGQVTVLPDVIKTTLPEFVKDGIKSLWKKNDLEQGTIVLLINPDRIRSFALPSAFQAKMLQNIGLTYRHFMPEITFYVNDKKVEMIDPLFLNPNCIGYESNNGFKAEGLDEMNIRVKNKLVNGESVEGNIKLRFSFMHPKFQRDKDRNIIGNRFNTMKENNGYFIVCRSGRQIDIVKVPNYQSDEDNISLVNFDRNWAIEVDFQPELDELFGVTTNKQQVEIDSYLWDIFKEHNIPATIKGFRKKFDSLRTQEKVTEEEKKEENRESEVIMTEAEKFDKLELPKEKKEKAKAKLLEDAKEVAKEEKIDVKVAVQRLEEEADKKKFKIEYTNLPGAPFYDIDQWGGQTVIRINAAHRFYGDIYAQQDGRGKTALELLIFVLAKCELESEGDKLLFYGNERFEWSRKLDLRLKMLDKKEPLTDRQSFEEENQ